MKHFLLPLAAAVLALLLVLQLRPDPDADPVVGPLAGEPLPVDPTAIAIGRATDAEVDDVGDELQRLERTGLAPLEAPTATLVVQVRRHDGRPLPHVEAVVGPPVVVDARVDDRTGETDADGRASFRLPGGTWKVRCSLGGNLEVALAPGDERTVELVLPASPLVRGLVKDDRGASIAGARVLVLGLTAAGIARLGARTAADGSFELPGIGAGRQIAAAAEGFAPSAPRRIELADADAPTITLVLARAHGFVQGSVTDVGGRALGRAVVWFGPVGTGSASARTGAPAQVLHCDENGRFTSPPLPLGEIEVRALAPGFALARATTTVVEGTPTELQVRLDLGTRVTGTVLRPDGSPAGDAIVFSGVRRSMGSRLARTAPDGSFALESVPSDGVDLTAMALDADGTTTLLARTTLQLAAGTEGTWVARLVAEARGAVRGVVATDTGEPLAGWLVLATPPGQRRGLGTETAADGSFTILGLPTGSHVEVAVRRPAAGWTSFADATQSQVEVDGPPLRFDLQVPAAGRGGLLGTVVDDDGRPLAATLHLQHESGAVAQYATRLDGTFRIDGVPVGTVQIEVRNEDYPSLRLPPREMTAGVPVDLGPLQLRRGGIAFGRVTGPDARPLANATLRLIDGNDREVAVADCTDGGYRTPWLAAGRYDLLIQADGAAPARVALQILAGQERELDVLLQPGVLHRFRVTTRDAADQERQCSVVVFDADRRAIWVAHLPMSRGVAEFRASLPPGRHEVLALGVREARATASITVEADGPNGPGLTELELVR